jgi:hypothetical protein
LIKEYAAAVGDGASDPMMAAAIKRAAELQALAEQARADAVRNGAFDTIALARIQTPLIGQCVSCASINTSRCQRMKN